METFVSQQYQLFGFVLIYFIFGYYDSSFIFMMQ